MKSFVALVLVTLILFTFIQLPVLSAEPVNNNHNEPIVMETYIVEDPELPIDNDTIIDGDPF